MNRTRKWLAALMTLALLLTALPTAALAAEAESKDWENTTDVKTYQELTAAIAAEEVKEIKVTASITVPKANEPLAIDKPVLIGKDGALKLEAGAVVTSNVPQGKFWYEDSAKTWEKVGADMAAFLLFSAEDGSNSRVLYGTQPDLAEALKANDKAGKLTTAVFSGADVTLSQDFDGDTLQVLGGKNLTVGKDVSVKTSTMSVTGNLTVSAGAKLAVETGTVAGTADFQGGKTQKPDKLNVVGAVRFAEVQPTTQDPKPAEDPNAGTNPAVNPFTDVAETSPFYQAILWAVEKKITNGVTDTTFVPGSTCTRAQILTFLWRAAGSPEPAGTENPFTDVPADAYYLKAALWAVEKGIVDKGETFGPFTPCTRASTVVYLWKHAGSPEVTTEKTFTDVAADAEYAAAVAWAVENGITMGVTETTFVPANTCTRGQIVTFLNRYLDKAGTEDPAEGAAEAPAEGDAAKTETPAEGDAAKTETPAEGDAAKTETPAEGSADTKPAA